MCVRVYAAHGKDLEEAVTGDTGGHFQRMLVILLQVWNPVVVFLKKQIMIL